MPQFGHTNDNYGVFNSTCIQMGTKHGALSAKLGRERLELFAALRRCLLGNFFGAYFSCSLPIQKHPFRVGSIVLLSLDPLLLLSAP
ncbi:MAG: hypothetical protein CFH37_01119 [Alphaproteobacteria bacterium MarineAlpha9_Bin7]|nr:MAG: hypothetical protein CFH37_01119 [Alphaproteobacteria bacterium MarineAlpha9_Bin7]